MTQIVHEVSLRQDQIQTSFNEIKNIKDKIKTQKEMIKAAYEDNAEYSSNKEQFDDLKKKLSDTRKKLDQTPTIFGMLQDLDELKAEKKDSEDLMFAQLELFSKETGKNEVIVNEQPMRIIKKFTLKNK